MSAKRGVVVAMLAGFLAVGGCASGKKPGGGEPTGNASLDSAPTAMTVENRLERLDAANDAFAAARKELRGHSDEQARRELANAFGKLQDVLQLLKGGEGGGAFRQQIRIIDRAREPLSGDAAAAPEPTVNAAVRAAYHALSSMAAEQFGDDESLKKLLDALQDRADVLNTVRGPIHGFETARALDDAGAITQRMTDLMQQRMPHPQPATAPAAAAQ
jgi:hypothetical protein